jgi:hypothetical protein
MAYRYEYEETDTDIAGMGRVLSAVIPGPDVDFIVYTCTIYDDDTEEELAVGYGHSKSEARQDAENNL